MRKDDPQYKSDCYERVAAARRLLLLAQRTRGAGVAWHSASRLLARRVDELAEVLNAEVLNAEVTG